MAAIQYVYAVVICVINLPAFLFMYVCIQAEVNECVFTYIHIT